MSINDKIESPNEIEQFFKSLNEENENEYCGGKKINPLNYFLRTFPVNEKIILII